MQSGAIDRAGGDATHDGEQSPCVIVKVGSAARQQGADGLLLCDQRHTCHGAQVVGLTGLTRGQVAAYVELSIGHHLGDQSPYRWDTLSRPVRPAAVGQLNAEVIRIRIAQG